MEKNHLVLVLTDGTKYQLSEKSIELSDFLKKKIGEKEILIEGIEKNTMDSVIDYLTHYEGIEPPTIEAPLPKQGLKSCFSNEEEDSFSHKFIQQFNMDNLANLCLAADLMEINPLLDLCCAKIASMCKDKEEQDILKNFGIKRAFTAEEKEKLKKEEMWVDEDKE